jgi:transposase
MWVATSAQVCVLFFAPTRSTAEVKALLGEEFAGILSSDCWSAYRPQPARLKQKCLTHFERDLSGLASSRFEANRTFAQGVFPVLQAARQAYGQYHQGELTLSQLQQFHPEVETRLDLVLKHPPVGGWAADGQNLVNRLRRHWDEWFTFLEHPEVKPDNNDAERAVRPVVIHRKVSGGARSHWGAQVVAMMFSFLETMRLQGKNAVEELANLLSQPQRSPPQLQPDLAQ